ncbi:MAG: hypothetical protein EAY81_02040 [Bacteroidetes bacterium]|nr:MAG: hypothetical protein EAY81_02040 [Bacteroidota bacterium]
MDNVSRPIQRRGRRNKHITQEPLSNRFNIAKPCSMSVHICYLKQNSTEQTLLLQKKLLVLLYGLFFL